MQHNPYIIHWMFFNSFISIMFTATSLGLNPFQGQNVQIQLWTMATVYNAHLNWLCQHLNKTCIYTICPWNGLSPSDTAVNIIEIKLFNIVWWMIFCAMFHLYSKHIISNNVIESCIIVTWNCLTDMLICMFYCFVWFHESYLFIDYCQ